MKKAAMAAVLAIAGLGLVLPSAASAAVLAPAGSAALKDAAALVTQVRSGHASRHVSAPRRVSPGNHRARPVGAARSFKQGRPSKGFNPARASVHKHGFRPSGTKRWHKHHLAHRKWHRRNYYGRIVGGIALGSLLAGSAYYAYASAPPAPGLCWYWADPSERQGYWDYCD